MDHPSGAEQIQWRMWDEEAFQAARREDKPVLLTLTATWCHWCHVMDRTTYSDSRVIGLINQRFVPVRVDVDQRPDLARRYNQGGFPSVAILDAQGELLAGRVYAPADEMARLLEEVRSRYPEGAPAIPAVAGPAAAASDPPPAVAGQEPPAGRVLGRLRELYDPDFGGFGLEPKQPPWEGLKFLLARYSRSGDRTLLEIVVRTLDGMREGLYDQNERGFFRYSVARDWRVPHYEKMLVTNASLAALFLEAYQLTGKAAYRKTAMGTLEYLLGTLYDTLRGGFYASQDAAEEYYHLPWKDRDQATKPSIDRNCYAGWNALAASALVQAAGVLGQGSFLGTAEAVLERLWSESWSSDCGMAHVMGGDRQQPPVLEDALYLLRALLDLHQATGRREHLRRATKVAGWIRDHLAAPDGGFYDVAASISGPGPSMARDRPVLENALLAEALVILSYLSGEDGYRALAERTLRTFNAIVPGRSYLGARHSRRMEEDEERLFLPAGSAWGRARDLLVSGPVHLVLVGAPSDRRTAGLLKAALRTYAPHRIIQLLDPEKDGQRISSLGFPTDREPSLYACMNGMCLAPMTTAKEVTALRTHRPWVER